MFCAADCITVSNQSRSDTLPTLPSPTQLSFLPSLISVAVVVVAVVAEAGDCVIVVIVYKQATSERQQLKNRRPAAVTRTLVQRNRRLNEKASQHVLPVLLQQRHAEKRRTIRSRYGAGVATRLLL